jgi:hypothetical protein
LAVSPRDHERAVARSLFASEGTAANDHFLRFAFEPVDPASIAPLLFDDPAFDPPPGGSTPLEYIQIVEQNFHETVEGSITHRVYDYLTFVAYSTGDLITLDANGLPVVDFDAARGDYGYARTLSVRVDFGDFDGDITGYDQLYRETAFFAPLADVVTIAEPGSASVIAGLFGALAVLRSRRRPRPVT